MRVNEMRPVLIFSGTTEGRELAQRLSEEGIPCTVCVATAYGQAVMPEAEGVTVLEGRLDTEEMEALMVSAAFVCAADATHPFAQEVSKNIREAALRSDLPYIRCARKTEDLFPENAAVVSSMEEAAAYLATRSGKILTTTGSKELSVLTRAVDPARVTARVLPDERSIALCREAGLSGTQIIAMQGPFSEEMNISMLHMTDAAYLLTKETGRAGGFSQKLQAAKVCGAIPVIIRNPEKEEKNVCSFEEALAAARNYCGLQERPQVRQVSLVGIGPGNDSLRTAEAEKAIAGADILFGAARVLEAIEPAFSGGAAKVPKIPLYHAPDIMDYLKEHPQYRSPVILFSGDTGFYSGAASAVRAFESSKDEWQVCVVCGISSVSYFSSRIGRPWQGWMIVSAHGRECPIVQTVRKHSAVFLLASDAEGVRNIGCRLADAEKKDILGEVSVTGGYQLSYPEEEIFETTPDGLATRTKEGLYVLLIENKAAAQTPMTPGLPDDRFIRDSVPMTKEEVRALCISKLGLCPDAVLYDIGAGTGSVSIEAARLSPDCTVYAAEEEEEALTLLSKNKETVAAAILIIVPGKAPESIAQLPAPTHVFIGGSGGALREIISCVLKKNPAARIVITSVTLETLTQAGEILADMPVTEPEICQVQVSRAVKRGRYHMMTAQNPVFIISCTGNGADGLGHLVKGEED